MKVFLRDYLDKMRALIDKGHAADAIALGQHCLRYYPRQVEVYRLLGEACLDSNSPDAALDLFQRVLSADPENVVANVGLALIHDQRGEVDQAVSYITRAFELQPTNAQIRQEYARLRVPRDDVSAASLKFTPAVLARTYLLEELYPQALQELRALTRDDSTRFDLRIALAETLFRLGQLRESANEAEQILIQLPYCIKANLLLGYALMESGAQDGQVYLHRAIETDPEGIFARYLFGDRTPVKSEKPQLPSVEDAAHEDTQKVTAAMDTELFNAPTPETRADLKTELATEDQAPEQGTPDWPSAPQTETPLPIPATVESGVHAPMPRLRPEIPTALDALPPWLRDILQPPEILAPVPLLPVAPKPVAVEPTAPPSIEPSKEIPDWLQAIAPPGMVAPVETAEPTTVTQGAPQEEMRSTDALPDWLKEIPTKPREEGTSTLTTESTVAPDWIVEAETTTKSETPRAETTVTETMPPWIGEIQPPSTSSTVTTSAAVPESEAPAGMSEAEIEKASATTEDFVSPPLMTDAVPYPDWLANLPTVRLETGSIAEPQAPEAELPPAAPVVESGEIPYPEWVTSLPTRSTQQVEMPHAEEAPTIANEISVASQTETPSIESAVTQTMPAWLKELEQPTASTAATTSTTETQTQASAGLREAEIEKASVAAEEFTATPLMTEVVPYPDGITTLSSAPARVEALPETQTPTPVETLQVEKSVAATQMTAPDVESEEFPFPEWMLNLSVPPTQPQSATPRAEEAPAMATEIEAPAQVETARVEETRATIEPSAPAVEAQTIPYPEWMMNFASAPTIQVQASPAETDLPKTVASVESFEPATPNLPSEEKQPGPSAPPDWLKDLSAEPNAEVTTPLEPTASSDVPDWLKELTLTESKSELKPSEPAVEFPHVEEKTVPPEESLLRHARSLMDARDFNGALKEYEQVLHRAPSALSDIIADLERMVKMDNVPNAAHRVLGDAYSLAGRYKESIEQYRQVLGRWQK